MMKAQERENYQARASTPKSDATKKKHFYALQSRGDQESSPDVVTGILQLFFFDVFSSFNPGATL